ncbi:MAG TPA: YggS family pyridoxal phosphate-dependent enzyme [Chitinophagaceae bacterium]|nr:YggS family pyridoxal phosphate-dependent enzyme [Chitinophagaceae bacterium]
MPINVEEYKRISTALALKHITLVAVSKTKPVEDIFALYTEGQRDFGENYVQELVEKHLLLPHDIKWHFIGHLQSNKVKYIAPFVHLIQGVDGFKLLREIDKHALKHHRTINCLLQVHIALEETKFGLSEAELDELMEDLKKANETGEFRHIKIVGLMGMASFVHDPEKIRGEFKYLNSLFDKYSKIILPNFEMTTLSMGMSSDYKIAIEEGSNMVRIGSLVFGERS